MNYKLIIIETYYNILIYIQIKIINSINYNLYIL